MMIKNSNLKRKKALILICAIIFFLLFYKTGNISAFEETLRDDYFSDPYFPLDVFGSDRFDQSPFITDFSDTLYNPYSLGSYQFGRASDLYQSQNGFDNFDISYEQTAPSIFTEQKSQFDSLGEIKLETVFPSFESDFIGVQYDLTPDLSRISQGVDLKYNLEQNSILQALKSPEYKAPVLEDYVSKLVDPYSLGGYEFEDEKSAEPLLSYSLQPDSFSNGVELGIQYDLTPSKTVDSTKFMSQLREESQKARAEGKHDLAKILEKEANVLELAKINFNNDYNLLFKEDKNLAQKEAIEALEKFLNTPRDSLTLTNARLELGSLHEKNAFELARRGDLSGEKLQTVLSELQSARYYYQQAAETAKEKGDFPTEYQGKLSAAYNLLSQANLLAFPKGEIETARKEFNKIITEVGEQDPLISDKATLTRTEQNNILEISHLGIAQTYLKEGNFHNAQISIRFAREVNPSGDFVQNFQNGFEQGFLRAIGYNLDRSNTLALDMLATRLRFADSGKDIVLKTNPLRSIGDQIGAAIFPEMVGTEASALNRQKEGIAFIGLILERNPELSLSDVSRTIEPPLEERKTSFDVLVETGKLLGYSADQLTPSNKDYDKNVRSHLDGISSAMAEALQNPDVQKYLSGNAREPYRFEVGKNYIDDNVIEDLDVSIFDENGKIKTGNLVTLVADSMLGAEGVATFAPFASIGRLGGISTAEWIGQRLSLGALLSSSKLAESSPALTRSLSEATQYSIREAISTSPETLGFGRGAVSFIQKYPIETANLEGLLISSGAAYGINKAGGEGLEPLAFLLAGYAPATYGVLAATGRLTIAEGAAVSAAEARALNFGEKISTSLLEGSRPAISDSVVLYNPSTFALEARGTRTLFTSSGEAIPVLAFRSESLLNNFRNSAKLTEGDISTLQNGVKVLNYLDSNPPVLVRNDLAASRLLLEGGAERDVTVFVGQATPQDLLPKMTLGMEGKERVFNFPETEEVKLYLPSPSAEVVGLPLGERIVASVPNDVVTAVAAEDATRAFTETTQFIDGNDPVIQEITLKSEMERLKQLVDYSLKSNSLDDKFFALKEVSNFISLRRSNDEITHNPELSRSIADFTSKSNKLFYELRNVPDLNFEQKKILLAYRLGEEFNNVNKLALDKPFRLEYSPSIIDVNGIHRDFMEEPNSIYIYRSDPLDPNAPYIYSKTELSNNQFTKLDEENLKSMKSISELTLTAANKFNSIKNSNDFEVGLIRIVVRNPDGSYSYFQKALLGLKEGTFGSLGVSSVVGHLKEGASIDLIDSFHTHPIDMAEYYHTNQPLTHSPLSTTKSDYTGDFPSARNDARLSESSFVKPGEQPMGASVTAIHWGSETHLKKYLLEPGLSYMSTPIYFSKRGYEKLQLSEKEARQRMLDAFKIMEFFESDKKAIHDVGNQFINLIRGERTYSNEFKLSADQLHTYSQIAPLQQQAPANELKMSSSNIAHQFLDIMQVENNGVLATPFGNLPTRDSLGRTLTIFNNQNNGEQLISYVEDGIDLNVFLGEDDVVIKPKNDWNLYGVQREAIAQDIKLIHFGKPASGDYVWVVDRNGNFIIGNREFEHVPEGIVNEIENKLAHSVLARGREIYGAGTVSFKDGYVEKFNSITGHYYPGLNEKTDFDKQMEEVFREAIKTSKLSEVPEGAIFYYEEW
ncbi:hypothetical protein HYW75_03160 [Candidatus Pacearchaeota archaeon]|nr:hypothetical protein [Candidatus Pacearchaeota archaeon]